MVYRRQYGSQEPIYFFMWATDGTALQAGADNDAGDFQISKDGGSFANVTGTFAAVASGLYKYTPAAADLQCKVACLKFVDADTAVLDKPLIIETEGHPLALHPLTNVPFSAGVLSGTHTTTSAQFSSGTKPAAIGVNQLVWNATKLEGRPASGYTFATGIVAWASTLALGSAWDDDDAIYVFPGTPTEGVDVKSISGDATAADNLESAFDGTGYDVGGVDVSELNQIVDDLINGGRIDLLIDAMKAVLDNLPDSGALTTLVTHLTDIKGGTFSGSTDSLEAIRNRGDAAWVTGAGGSAPTVEEIRAEIDSNSTQFVAVLAAIAALNDLDSTAVQAAAAAAIAAAEPVDANLTAVGGQTTIDGQSLLALYRFVLAYVAGDTTGFDTDTPAIVAADGSKTRLASTLDASKNRTMTTRDGS